MPRALRLGRVLETCLYATDLAAAEAFYGGVLGLQVVEREPERHVFCQGHQQMVLIFNPHATRPPDGDVPPHGAFGPGHVAFAVDGDALDHWREHLLAHGVTIERERRWDGRGRSLYVRDPAGNSVELAMPQIWGLPD